jgi:hypothetical protein
MQLALQEFVRHFDGKISDEVFKALHALFKVVSPEQEAIDDAMINHAGATCLELEDERINIANV